MWLDEFKKLDLKYVKYDEDLKKYNTFKVGSTASVIASPTSLDELLFILNYVKDYKIEHMILGNGSNVIFSSKNYDGVIIRLNNLNNITFEDKCVTVDAGYSLIKLSNELCAKGITGFVFATGIPGSVGGAIYMNAGAYKSSISEILISVTYLDDKLKVKTITNDKCKFGYRDSLFKHNDYIILSAKFKLEKGDVETIKNLVNDRREKRFSSQPLDLPSAGSTFRNPDDIPAWKLIDGVGLRGYRIGGVSVSEKHSNFIVNDKDGTGEDIYNLVNKIKEEVKKEYNVDLQLEPELINF